MAWLRSSVIKAVVQARAQLWVNFLHPLRVGCKDKRLGNTYLDVVQKYVPGIDKTVRETAKGNSHLHESGYRAFEDDSMYSILQKYHDKLAGAMEVIFTFESKETEEWVKKLHRASMANGVLAQEQRRYLNFFGSMLLGGSLHNPTGALAAASHPGLHLGSCGKCVWHLGQSGSLKSQQ